MKKKKLLIVAQHLTIGGAQKSLLAALKVLDYEKFDVTLYLRKNRTDLLSCVDERVNVIINDDKSHYYRKPYAVLLQGLSAFWKVIGEKEKAEKYNNKLKNAIVNYSMEYEKKHFFSSEKYDIAIAYVHGYPALFVAECVNAEKKYVFFHTSVDELHDMHKKILSKFTGVLAEHDLQKDLLEEWYSIPPEKIHIIENYVDRELILLQSKSEFIEVPEDKIILCYCGRITSVKGFDLAVKAAKILKDNNVPFLWLFVGDGPDREKVEQLIKKYNLEEDIVITGMKKNPYPYIAASHIYVQSSYEENTGITILEAHRLDKPVVSTKTVGGKKLVKHQENGLLAEINEFSLAENIIALINDKQLMASISKNLKSQNYSDEFERHKLSWQKLLEE
ncbi:MAG: glycosyltransferase [Clostridia bacterium]|nr:glycosyltransferase [Clostridia bacterium]